MEGKTKPFKAFATAIRAERLRQKHSAAFNNSDYVEELSTEVKELISKINKYVNKYRSSYMSHDLTEAVLLVAEQNNLWDEELRSDLDKAEKLFKGPLDFLGLVHVPVKNSGGEKYDKKAINALRDLLKYRKFKMDAAFYNTKPHDKLEDILSSEDTDQEEGLDDEEGELVNVTIVEEDEDDVAVDVDEEELETV